MNNICSRCMYQSQRGGIYCQNCRFNALGNDPFNQGYPTSPTPERPPQNNGGGSSNYPFANSNWASAWERIAKSQSAACHGIILTNTEKCADDLKGKFKKALDEYISFNLNKKTQYCVLDMADQAILSKPSSIESNSVSFVVDVLTKVYEVAPIEYILIVGDRECIDSIKWENPLYSSDGWGDRDKYVDSDVPYVFLNTDSLFEGANVDKCISVGRVPSTAKSGFAEAILYFENLIKLIDNVKKIQSCSLSAEEWKHVSHINFGAVNPEEYSCPPYSFVKGVGHRIPNSTPYNLLCFNLHGGAVANVWASGDGTIGMDPDSLPSDPSMPYVIGTEACYGAKPVIKNSKEQSILITSLQNRCIGFLGSTQIAYGMPDIGLVSGASPSCADILVGCFAECVAKGYSLGESYLTSWLTLAQNCSAAEEVKTLCSFALYGDPTAVLISGNEKKSKISSKIKNTVKPIIGIAEKTTQANISNVSMRSVENLVKSYFGCVPKEQTKYYKISNSSAGGSIHTVGNSAAREEYKATYVHNSNRIAKIMQVYFNASGEVTRAFVSK